MNKNIGIIVGSLREGSYNRQVAETLINLFGDKANLEIIEVGNLPLYNEDLDAQEQAPAEYTEFRNKVKEKDAMIFVTPEYNRSMSAATKNAIDVGSRPYDQQVWGGKYAGVLSASMSGFGANLANQDLRRVLNFLNMKVMPQPEMYIAEAHNSFEDGKATVKLETFLQGFVDAFTQYIG